MFKRILGLALLTSCSVFADEQAVTEYSGKVSNIFSGKGAYIKFSVTQKEDEPIECLFNEENQWPFQFERDKSYSNQWFDIVNMARLRQETIRIGYTENTETSCDVEYLALMQSDGNTSDYPVGDALSRSGKYGNIALIYTNNLSESSFRSSDYDGADVAAAGFDGHLWQEQIEDGLGSMIERGIWVVKKDKDDESAQYWLQVEFDDVVKVTGFRVLVNNKSVELGRSARGVTILGSVDGDEFVEYASYTLSKSVDQRANLPEIAELKYFRIRVDSNYGNDRIEIDELEVYSDY